MRKYITISLLFFVVLFVVFTFNANTQASRKTFHKGTQQELNLAKTMSYEYLAKFAAPYGIDSAKDLRVSKVEVDELSMAHTKMQQSYNNVPVFGGETIVHLNSDGSLFSITDSLVSHINVNTEAQLSRSEAINKAIEIYGCEICLTAEPKVDMFVLRRKGKDHLVYRIKLERLDGTNETAMPIYFIDAHTGKKVWGYNNLQTATAVGTGTTNYYGTKSFNTVSEPFNFYLEDTSRKIGILDYRHGQYSAYPSDDSDNIWNTTYQKTMVDVMYATAATYDYFKNVHGRNGIDGNGGPTTRRSQDGFTGLMTSRVHYGVNYNNAFWSSDGKYAVFGDGDGSKFSSLTTLDMVAHELTHGITQDETALVYEGESGALHESISDVFGAMVERSVLGESPNTWKLGELCFRPNNGNDDALRRIDIPHVVGGYESTDTPDHKEEFYEDRKNEDNGGVHTNCGIPNKVFYLLAKGGTHHRGGSMTGVGVDTAAKIWYKALTQYMTSDTNFIKARQATLDAAASMYGRNSHFYYAVCKAWALCGVGNFCNSELINNGGFESSFSPWVPIGSGVVGLSSNSSSQSAHSGNVYLNMGDGYGLNLTGKMYQNVYIPPDVTKVILSYYFTGTTQESAQVENDKLYVEIRDSGDRLLETLTTHSNRGILPSVGYQFKTHNLLAYKGQNIRVHFRVQTNNSAPTSFFIDDVSVNLYE